MAKDEMSADEALNWLVNQTILGVSVEGDCLMLVFKVGHLLITGEDYDAYVETQGQQS